MKPDITCSVNRQRICPTCESEFAPKAKNQIYCAKACLYKVYNQTEKRKQWRRERESWRRKHDPIYIIKQRTKARLHKVLKKAGLKKECKMSELFGCSAQFLRQHIESKFTRGMSWRNQGEWHLDHVTPLSSVNLQDPAKLRAVWHYSNLRPLWKKENQDKAAKIVTHQPELLIRMAA
jgi:hypothetical protein